MSPRRYLEDFVPQLEYRPSASVRTKKGKEAEEESKRLHDELVTKGIDDESLKAIQTISRSDRIDFEVWLFMHLLDRASLTLTRNSSYFPSSTI